MSTDAAVYPSIQWHAYIGLYFIVFCLLLCGGLFPVCYMCSSSFPTCSQQHVVDVLAVASLGTSSTAAATTA